MLTPKALSWLILLDVVANVERNAMHNIKIEWQRYAKEG
jgi:hypothetical protein